MVKPLNPHHTPYHPKWYRRRIPIFWWLRKRSYTKFITRELTSVFVAYSAALLLIQAWILGRGQAAYERFLGWLQHPAVLAFHALVLVAVLFHTITWLNLTPKALVMRIGRRRIPGSAIVALHYLAWFVVSGALAWLLVGRS